MAELAAGAAIHSSAGVPDGDKQKPYLVARDVEGATYQDSLDGLKVYSKKLKHEGLFEYSGLDMADDILSRNQEYIHKGIGAMELGGGLAMQAGGMLGSAGTGGMSLFAVGAGSVMAVSGHSKMAGRYESREGSAVLRSFAEPTGSYYFHRMGEAVAYDTLAAAVGGKALEGAVRLGAKTFTPSVKSATREAVTLETHAAGAAKAELRAADSASVRAVKVSKAGENVWEKGPVTRGEAIEASIGRNLHQNFPVIDRFEHGVVTSIKSIDLNAKTYQNPVTLRRTLRNYVDKVAGFKRGAIGEQVIEPAQIHSRKLELAIPRYKNVDQQKALIDTISYAKTKGIELEIIMAK